LTLVYLVRHGETVWNAARRVQGHTNSALSDRGRQQAHAVAARLGCLPIQAIYSSDLTRALDTAAPIAATLGLGIVPTAELREKSYGQWEGMTEDEIRAADPAGWHRYHVERQLDYAIPGGETWPKVQTRIVGALHHILADHPKPEDAVLLVGHGGSLRAAILDALQAPLSTLLRLRLDNASVSLLEYRSGHGGRVVSLNDTSHWSEPPL
jgi:broad specificity phosphatase PhoE